MQRGQPDGHRGPLARLRADANLAVVVVDDAMDDSEPEAAALRESAVERLEETVEILRWNPDSFVLHSQDHVARRRVHRARQPQTPAIRHRSQAVGGKIPDHLLDLTFISLVPQLLRRHIHLHEMPIVEIRSVAKEHRRVVEHSGDIETGNGKALGPGVGEKRADRAVQPLGLSKDDVHQLLLLGAKRKLLRQNLNRAGNGSGGFVVFVGDAGRHFANSCEPLLYGVVTLQLLDLRHVLKAEQKASPANWRLEMGRAETQLDLAPSIPSPEMKLATAPGCVRHVVVESACNLRRQLQHLSDGSPERSRRRDAGDAFRRTIEGQDALLWVRGDESTWEAIDDVLIQRLQI